MILLCVAITILFDHAYEPFLATALMFSGDIEREPWHESIESIT